MKKIKLLIVSVGIFLLTGCGLSELEFQGKTQPTEDVQEILESMLEMENPHLDLEVIITKDAD